MQNIDRFKLEQELGGGSQWVAYLGLDPDLQRKIVIKLSRRVIPKSSDEQQSFLHMARSVGALQHANIVALYESGQYKDHPYLVLEYVEGELLSRALANADMELAQGLDLFAGLLSGMSQVHQQGLVHGNLRPSNIILGPDGNPKIMDFGLSLRCQLDGVADINLVYLAPEIIQGEPLTTQSDVYALGAILYELLAGGQLFDTSLERQQVLEQIQQKSVTAPSRLGRRSGQHLDAILLKALEKTPAARFGSAEEFLAALQAYRESADPEQSSAGKGTVEFLMRRMQHKSDFPVLSESICTLNRLAASTDEDLGRLTSVIIRDFALTNKLLKVVNSAYYSGFAGKIGSISRAIVVLGMKPIRSIAASLIFFEHLHDKTQAAKLRDEIAGAVFSATMARQLGQEAGLKDDEGSFLCAMLHNLGRILVAYYLSDEQHEIERLIGQAQLRPEVAQMRVLGMTYQQIGIAIAKQWNFPKAITRGMAKADPAVPGDMNNPEVKQRMITSFANEVSQAIGTAGAGEEKPWRSLLQRYRSCLEIEEKAFERMLADARREFRELSGALANGKRSRFMQRLVQAQPMPETPRETPAPTELDDTRALQPSVAPEPEPAPADKDHALPSPDAEAILTEGLQEATALLLEPSCNMNQLFNLVLETIYRAMAFEHVLLCLHDRGKRRYLARLGFGEAIDDFMGSFGFGDRYSPTVFHAALKNAADIYIEDTAASKIQDSIPGWYSELSSAGSFLLFPLVVGKHPLGLIYADHPRSKGMNLSAGQLNLLKALRNQIVLGFRSMS